MNLDRVFAIFFGGKIQSASATFHHQISPSRVTDDQDSLKLGIDSSRRHIDDVPLTFDCIECVVINRAVRHDGIAD